MDIAASGDEINRQQLEEICVMEWSQTAEATSFGTKTINYIEPMAQQLNTPTANGAGVKTIYYTEPMDQQLNVLVVPSIGGSKATNTLSSIGLT
jgi:hypothetical protein